MKPNIIALEEIQIAQPCRADWQNMTGDEHARFCGSCHKNVYDISQMTREEAHQLIAAKEGDVCLRLHRRPDGTVITSDCPIGITATPRPLWFGVAALMALIGSGLAGCAASEEPTQGVLQMAAPNHQSVETQHIAPIKVETPPMNFGDAKPVPITNHPASVGQLSGVTLGAPMMPKPTPKSAPEPQPTSEPQRGEPTMGRIAVAPAAVETTMREMAPICEKTR